MLRRGRRRRMRSRGLLGRAMGSVLFLSLLGASPSQAARRLPAPGDLDQSFGVGGRVGTRIARGGAAADVAIQPDGKIIAAGSSWTVHRSLDFALARYDQAGRLDPGFGRNGIVLTDFGLEGVDEILGVALQSNGMIVAVGAASVNDGDFGLARYNPDGTLDASFGERGKVTTDLGVADIATDVAIQADGKIVVVGRYYGGTDTDFAVLRYQPDGALDQGFGTGGVTLTDLDGDAIANSVVLGPDGKIIVGGFRLTPGMANSSDFVLARYTTTGALDPSFGSGGTVVSDFLGESEESYGVALQPDGAIVAAGRALPGTDECDLLTARYLTDGSLDPAFGSGGVALTDIGQCDQAEDVAVQPDSKIVVVGQTEPPGPNDVPDFAIVRYGPAGALDQGFGSGGIVTTEFRGYDVAEGVSLQVDGRIVVCGQNDVDSIAFVLARYVG